MEWQEYIVTDINKIYDLLRSVRRVAVLGMRPEQFAQKPAFYVPSALSQMGLKIVPISVHDQSIRQILGETVYYRVADIPEQVDLVDVFRRSEDIPAHLDDIIAKKPTIVWFQLGIRNDEAAEQLARAGIYVVQDRCLMVDYRHFTLSAAKSLEVNASESSL